jgi:hypothetical protein
MRVIKNTYLPLALIVAVIGAILTVVYISTKKYNADKESEVNATTSAFLAGKPLNCINGGSEEDVSKASGWQYRDSDGNIRFKKDSVIFLPTQCKEITTK